MAKIKTSDYTIAVSKDIASEINTFIETRRERFSRLFILVDENSLKCCYPQLVAEIPAFEDAEIIEIESGEENKNIEVCAQLWVTLDELGADRQALFVNLGGGVIGDMGGFVASTFKRGIAFINIPTTLLAQVDASVGGKVGIDLNHVKNLVGVFNNPKAVFVNPDFIATLDNRQLLSGFAEVIKHGLIADPGYWQKIKKTNTSSPESISKLIETSIRIKNKIVSEDPFEKSIRKALNFGHTVGHAIESHFLESGQPLLHGEAIAIGMVCEAWLSNKITGLPDESLREITTYISSLYPYHVIEKPAVEHITELMFHDKKNTNGKLNFSLLSEIGKCEINQTASIDLVKKALDYYINTVR
ncbi:MAG: 3-dehydroquinate synthase [Bacteroidia bacterium]